MMVYTAKSTWLALHLIGSAGQDTATDQTVTQAVPGSLPTYHPKVAF